MPDPEVLEQEAPVPPIVHTTGPEQLVRDQRIPIDPATGAEYLSGEIPLGWNEPVP